VKLAAVVGIHLGLLFQILRMFKPRNTKDMYSIYVVCFWVVLMMTSIVIINPYDEDSIEYMLSKEDIEKLKGMTNENIIENPVVVPKIEGLSEPSNKSSDNSTKNIILAVVMMVFFGGLKIYSFLRTPV
jgi:hypothetical protein